jgi:hypothetical protein
LKLIWSARATPQSKKAPMTLKASDGAWRMPSHARCALPDAAEPANSLWEAKFPVSRENTGNFRYYLANGAKIRDPDRSVPLTYR